MAKLVSKAMKTLWAGRKDLRLESACRRYAQGEIWIGGACEIAEVEIESFKKALACKGIPRQSMSTMEEIKENNDTWGKKPGTSAGIFRRPVGPYSEEPTECANTP